MTTAILIYDIPDDRLRSKVADACLDYGLDRIQYASTLSFAGWGFPVGVTPCTISGVIFK